MFINLATQVMIAAWSKSKHYNPHDIDEHMPTLTATDHDELGLIRAIVVKVSCLSTGIVGETIYILIILKERSSPQRKELFKTIQHQVGIDPIQLLLDMKIHWGSTHVMLKRSLSCRTVSLLVTPFVQI